MKLILDLHQIKHIDYITIDKYHNLLSKIKIVVDN